MTGPTTRERPAVPVVIAAVILLVVAIGHTVATVAVVVGAGTAARIVLPTVTAIAATVAGIGLLCGWRVARPLVHAAAGAATIPHLTTAAAMTSEAMALGWDWSPVAATHLLAAVLGIVVWLVMVALTGMPRPAARSGAGPMAVVAAAIATVGALRYGPVAVAGTVWPWTLAIAVHAVVVALAAAGVHGLRTGSTGAQTMGWLACGYAAATIAAPGSTGESIAHAAGALAAVTALIMVTVRSTSTISHTPVRTVRNERR